MPSLELLGDMLEKIMQPLFEQQQQQQQQLQSSGPKAPNADGESDEKTASNAKGEVALLLCFCLNFKSWSEHIALLIKMKWVVCC